ncbi:hypothetical protein ENU1_088270 [Entamoeba nuttalli P19]|uniref:Uncharacterized protein n=2 Tax=Entamoeba nuttalli TaxID=412467 RepID=K2GD67_ENTNP|nr:hypothetical protein ENU1_088270 [Entamoeba nuttalli P19]EKE40511.1 hypothetical protein ENU1_088270 [Entamoeba nuttalli P19]|eukprot:XP_008857153.1 hypothetical protein ENU1_088270 [Entamoeba nuttalli P19]
MEPLNQHNTLLPKPLDIVSSNEIDSKVLSLEDNVIGKLISYRTPTSILEVNLPHSKVNVTRLSESLRKLPQLTHSTFCETKPTECLGCFFSGIINIDSSTSNLSRTRSPLPLVNCIEKKVSELKSSTSRQRIEFPYSHQKSKIEAPKGYPIIPLKPSCLPYPPQFLIPPQKSYLPRKVRLHSLHHKKVQHEEIVIKETPKKNDTFIYITDYLILESFRKYFRGINVPSFISTVTYQLNNYSYDFGSNNIIKSLCDSLEMLRTVQVIMDGLDSGKLTIPNDVLDPVERTLVSQLLNEFFIPPSPFINPISSQQTPVPLEVPKIILGAMRNHMNESVELTLETSWNVLSLWEDYEFAPFSYQKEINYLFITQEGIDQEIVHTIIKELEFDYKNFNLGRLIKYSENIIVSNIFDELEMLEVIKNHSQEISDKKIIVLYDPKDSNEEEIMCKTITLKCRLNEGDCNHYGDNTIFISLKSILKDSLRETSIRVCFSLYSSYRRYRPTQYPNSAAQALPDFTQNGNLLNEPLFIISPQYDNVFFNKIMIGYKVKPCGIISSLISYTGELQEMGFDTSIQEMWDRWICFIQQTTKSHWEITFTKVGEYDNDEMKLMFDLKESALQQYKDLIDSIFISCCNVYGSVLVSEEEYQLLDNNKGFYKINDELDPPIEIKGEGRATYYTILPSLIGKGSSVGGYSIHLYDSNEKELSTMMKIFHGLSFLNSDVLKQERWSILPKHLHLLQKYDLYLDMVMLCEH